MSIESKDLVLIQRNDGNTAYARVDVSASNAVIYLNSSGHAAVSKIATFPYTWPLATTASWASQSFSSTSSSFSVIGISASYFSGSQITASTIAVGTIFPLSSSIGTPTQKFSSIYTHNLYGTSSVAQTSSFSSISISSSYSSTSSFATTASFAVTYSYTYVDVEILKESSSFSSQSFVSVSSSYSSGSTSSSFALVAYSSLNGGTTLSTGSFYPITSSWSTNSSVSQNCSHSISSSFASSSVSASYASIYNGSVASSSYSISTSFAPTPVSVSFAGVAQTANSINFKPLSSTSSSYASSSISSSYTLTATTALSISFTPLSSTSASYASSSTSASYALTYNGPVASSSYASVAAVAHSINFTPGSTVSSSYASSSTSASYALTYNGSVVSSSYAITATTANSINFKPLSSTSSSYASSSLSASYALNYNGSVASASYAAAAQIAYSINFKPTSATSASYASSSTSASYAISFNGSVTSASYAGTATTALSIGFTPGAAVSASYASASTSAGTSVISSTSSYVSGSMFVGNWPPNITFGAVGTTGLQQTASGNYALIQSHTTGQTILNTALGQQLNLRVNNSNVLVITGSNVGIGTTTPIAPLQVAGVIQSTSNLSGSGLLLGWPSLPSLRAIEALGLIETTGSQAGLYFGDRNTGGTNWLWYSTDDIARLRYPGLDVFHIGISGSSGVLKALGPFTSSGVNSTGTNYFIGGNSIFSGSSAKIGIGTESPASPISIRASGTGSSFHPAGWAFNRETQTGAIVNSTSYAFQLTAIPSAVRFEVYSGSGGIISQNAVVIDSAANVGIGTATPSSKFTVSGNASVSNLTASHITCSTITSSNIKPDTHVSRNLGTPSFAWSNVYTDFVSVYSEITNAESAKLGSTSAPFNNVYSLDISSSRISSSNYYLPNTPLNKVLKLNSSQSIIGSQITDDGTYVIVGSPPSSTFKFQVDSGISVDETGIEFIATDDTRRTVKAQLDGVVGQLAIGSSLFANDNSRVGVGTSSPGTTLHVQGNISSSKINLSSNQNQVSSSGDVWYNNTGSAFLNVRKNNLDGGLSSCIYVQSSSITVLSVTETDLFTEWYGSKKLPSNSMRPGNTIRINARGYHNSLTAPNTHSLQPRIRIGSDISASVYVDFGVLTITGNNTNKLWMVNSELVIRSIGATGSVIGQSMFQYMDGTSWNTVPHVISSSLDINTTIDNYIYLTVEQNTSTVNSDNITITNGTVEILGV